MSSADTQSIQIEIESLFATPVAITPMPDAENINAGLRKTILDRAENHPSTSHSNLGGWQSTTDLAEWGGLESGYLLTFVQQMADRLTVDRVGNPAPQDWEVYAWANINRAGNGNEFHTHPGCVWSAVYYVDDGGTGGDPSQGGQLEIQDPRGVAPAMYRPELVPDIKGGGAFGATELISPVPGMILMFPSWLSHAVRPYTGDGTRISIAINLS